MDYAEVRDAFFQPRDGATPSAPGSPARSLRDAIEPIAMICYWAEPAYDALAALGLDFLSGYVWGRSSVLGDADGAVAAAAFGVFEPAMVADLHAAGRAAAGLADVRAARLAGSTTALEAVLGPDAGAAGEVAGRLRAAADAGDPVGRPLYAGARALPWPEHPLAALWHVTTVLREYRGDSHLAACVAAGLTGLQANLLTEYHVGFEPQSYTASRGWSPDAMTAATDALRERGLVADDALTAEGRALRDDVEDATDRAVAPVVDALGTELPGLVDTLDGWSSRIVEAGWFPPDPYKRAAG